MAAAVSAVSVTSGTASLISDATAMPPKSNMLDLPTTIPDGPLNWGADLIQSFRIHRTPPSFITTTLSHCNNRGLQRSYQIGSPSNRCGQRTIKSMLHFVSISVHCRRSLGSSVAQRRRSFVERRRASSNPDGTTHLLLRQRISLQD